MTKSERQPSKEIALRQNVRVGDRLGIRLIGEGTRLDLRPVRSMSETKYFREVYIRGKDGEEMIRIKPDLSATHFFLMGNGENARWAKTPLENPTLYDYFPLGIIGFGKIGGRGKFEGEEIVIIPEHAYQTPDSLSMLPQSTIAEEFAQIEASLDTPK